MPVRAKQVHGGGRMNQRRENDMRKVRSCLAEGVLTLAMLAFGSVLGRVYESSLRTLPLELHPPNLHPLPVCVHESS